MPIASWKSEEVLALPTGFVSMLPRRPLPYGGTWRSIVGEAGPITYVVG